MLIREMTEDECGTALEQVGFGRIGVRTRWSTLHYSNLFLVRQKASLRGHKR